MAISKAATSVIRRGNLSERSRYSVKYDFNESIAPGNRKNNKKINKLSINDKVEIVH